MIHSLTPLLLLLFLQAFLLLSSTPNPGSLLLSAPKDEQNPERAQRGVSEEDDLPPTPDVDELLECTFSYMKAEDDGAEHQPDEDRKFPCSPPASRAQTVRHPCFDPYVKTWRGQVRSFHKRIYINKPLRQDFQSDRTQNVFSPTELNAD